MKREKLTKQIITAAMASAMLLSVSSTVLAQPETCRTTSPINQMEKGSLKKEHKGGINFQKYVDEKIISQEQANKIEKFMKKRAEERKKHFEKMKNMTQEEKKTYIQKHIKNKGDLFSELVKKKIITQEQANKIKDSMYKAAKEKVEQRRLKFEEKLKEEVAKGTITQEQSEKINTFVKERIEKRKADFEKMKYMTEEQRKAYMQQNPYPKTDLFTELVSSGIITEEQKSALKKAFLQDHSGNTDNNLKKSAQ